MSHALTAGKRRRDEVGSQQNVEEQAGYASATVELAPGTPVYEQNFDVELGLPQHQHIDPAVPGNLQPDKSRAKPNVCRLDLSGAAALLTSQIKPPQSLQGSSEASTSTSAAQTPKKKQVFEKGNYNRYYGYRLASGETEDPRLQVLQQHWFKNRRCMDIGCNEGILTLAVASKYCTKSMLGLDIDQELIKRACKALQKERGKVSKQLEVRLPSAKYRPLSASAISLSHVWFQQGEILSSKLEAGSFDTIMCMSVTKWIHLHGGDEVMHKFFHRVKELLAPGGYFVLEPQPWKSYKRAVNKLVRVSQNAKKVEHYTLGDLHLQPEMFPQYLTQTVGFKLLKEFKVPSKQAGFDRPVQWYKKE